MCFFPPYISCTKYAGIWKKKEVDSLIMIFFNKLIDMKDTEKMTSYIRCIYELRINRSMFSFFYIHIFFFSFKHSLSGCDQKKKLLLSFFSSQYWYYATNNNKDYLPLGIFKDNSIENFFEKSKIWKKII